jgi:hypothetical protein
LGFRWQRRIAPTFERLIASLPRTREMPLTGWRLSLLRVKAGWSVLPARMLMSLSPPDHRH